MVFKLCCRNFHSRMNSPSFFAQHLIFIAQEKRIVAPIRCGGVPVSYSKQLLLVGDAAGHVDPLTGTCRLLSFECVISWICSVYCVHCKLHK